MSVQPTEKAPFPLLYFPSYPSPLCTLKNAVIAHLVLFFHSHIFCHHNHSQHYSRLASLPMSSFILRILTPITNNASQQAKGLQPSKSVGQRPTSSPTYFAATTAIPALTSSEHRQPRSLTDWIQTWTGQIQASWTIRVRALVDLFRSWTGELPQKKLTDQQLPQTVPELPPTTPEPPQTDPDLHDEPDSLVNTAERVPRLVLSSIPILPRASPAIAPQRLTPFILQRPKARHLPKLQCPPPPLYPTGSYLAD